VSDEAPNFLINISNKYSNMITVERNNYKIDCKIFNDKSVPSVVDYLSVDVELEGERYKSLLNCWKANRKFKIITIEHDSHVGFSESEKKPQREFLISQGHFLLFGDVTNKEGASYEDWWINPEFFNLDDLIGMKSEGEYWVNIIEKINRI
jgi:hypothetical protein